LYPDPTRAGVTTALSLKIGGVSCKVAFKMPKDENIKPIISGCQSLVHLVTLITAHQFNLFM